MAEHQPQFNLYTDNGALSKKFTEPHPKLDATSQDFIQAGIALATAYGYGLTEATLQSETTVFVRS